MISIEFQRPKGMRDVLAPESWRIEKFRTRAMGLATQYGFDLIETPILEQSSVFLRVGETTDIVQHERYRFEDVGGDDLTLRPEGTAAVARAYIENGLNAAPQPVRLTYWAPMFRREKPQAVRYRQHTQFGAELYGSDRPEAEAEVIFLALSAVEAVGLLNPVVRVNSIGCTTCRPAYRQALVAYYQSRRSDLCQDCQTRINSNPLRLLDCKIDVAIRAAAPDIADYWCEDCRLHQQQVMTLVQDAGRNIMRDPYLVRGLDYYTRTVFEVGHPQLGEGTALFGGGRYDGLTTALGGTAVPAVGFGMGVERLLSSVQDTFLPEPVMRVYVASLPGAQAHSTLLAEELRRAGLNANSDVLARSLKAQLKDAGRRADLVLIVGGQEWDNGQVVVRELATGSQQTISRDDILGYLSRTR